MNFTTGRSTAQVIDALHELRAGDPPTHGGRVLSYVYDPGIPGLDELISTAAAAFLPVNGLDPTTFSSVATLERDVIAFARHLTGGDGEVVGAVTSGGTESCLLAVKSARDQWRADHPGGSRPALVAGTTVHPAFHKACEYFDLRMVPVEVDVDTGTVPPEVIIAAVDDEIAAGTPPALVVLSAPNYPLGAIDDVARIAPALAARGVPVHVDACVGGFVLPFYPQEVPAWDFRVAGVRSISLDAHKYGYAPKGASVILYRGRDALAAQYFACVSWPGYPVVNPTLLGSRSATALAATWALIQALGTDGYRAAVGRISAAARKVIEGVRTIPGLRILGRPFGPLLALGADAGPGAVDPFHLVDALRDHGFLAQSQPAFGNVPRSAHLTLTPVTADVAEELISALTTAAAEVRGLPPAAPDPQLLAEVTAHGLPRKQAAVMATLESLPEGVARSALIQVLSAVVDPDAP